MRSEEGALRAKRNNSITADDGRFSKRRRATSTRTRKLGVKQECNCSRSHHVRLNIQRIDVLSARGGLDVVRFTATDHPPSAAESRQHAVPSTGKSSPTGGSAVAIGTPMTADAPQRSNVVPDSAVSATPKVKTSNGTLSSPKGAFAQAKSGKLNELNAGEIIPAKILSQYLCTSIPPWRKGSTWTGINNSTP